MRRVHGTKYPNIGPFGVLAARNHWVYDEYAQAVVLGAHVVGSWLPGRPVKQEMP